MNNKKRLDEFNSSDLKKFIKDYSNESSIEQKSQNNNDYIDPTLNLM